MKTAIAILALIAGIALGHQATIPTQKELDESAASLCAELGGTWTTYCAIELS